MVGPLTTEKGYAVQNQLFWELEDGEDTPELRWPLNIPVYDRMRRQDAQVISVIRAVTLPIRRTEWRIDPNGAPPEVAEFVARNLGLPLMGSTLEAPMRTRGRFSWQEHLRHALLMLTFGHAFFEQVYQYDGDRLNLRKLAYRPPLTISRIDVASDGGLVAIEQHGTTGKTDPRIPVDRLVAYVNDREGGNWLGASLLRPAYKSWVLKDRGLRVESQTIVRNGLGVPVYEASETPVGLPADDIKRRQDEEMEAGRKLAMAYRSGSSAGASIPHGAGLDLKGVSGNLPDARKPIQYYDEQIARAVLAHFLNLGGDDTTGSYALGDTFADFFTLSLQTVANQIADVTTQHVIEDLVDLNFGEDVPAPRIAFDEIGSRHPATAEGIRALVECGALTADEPLEGFIRTTHGLPDHDPDTARTRPNTPAAPDDPGDDPPVPPDTKEQT
ncbi:phage portal protein family protein [Brevibacterium aurantiacum]|uniref:phage portal protein family protein n=1 Tax=Brevibacterium aurantiacum TaxID=273384 RepID=UPI003F926813